MTDFIRHNRDYDLATGAVTADETTLTGDAIRLSRVADHERAQFGDGDLIAGETAVLFWTTADEYNDNLRPRPGDVVTWEEVEWTVKWVNPIALDGIAIAARVGVRR